MLLMLTNLQTHHYGLQHMVEDDLLKSLQASLPFPSVMPVCKSEESFNEVYRMTNLSQVKAEVSIPSLYPEHSFCGLQEE